MSAIQPGIQLSASAAKKILDVAAAQGRPGLMMRLAVEGGGCSGFRYLMGYVDKAEADDIVIERDGAKLLIDPDSAPLLAGAELDYVRELIGERFAIKNPQASAGCGCGKSFAT